MNLIGSKDPIQLNVTLTYQKVFQQDQANNFKNYVYISSPVKLVLLFWRNNSLTIFLVTQILKIVTQ